MTTETDGNLCLACEKQTKCEDNSVNKIAILPALYLHLLVTKLYKIYTDIPLLVTKLYKIYTDIPWFKRPHTFTEYFINKLVCTTHPTV
jgi:hypothetical protein